MTSQFRIDTYRNAYRRERGQAAWGDAAWQDWNIIEEAVRLARRNESHRWLFGKVLDLLHATECTDAHSDTDEARACRAHWTREANALSRAVRAALVAQVSA
jgi:hypothetical protein